uniref:LAT protein n=1 Tax=Human herpesvirus 2 TaxID=10310 RepID=Q69105_HHV2|nr:ORF1 [Human alphaherpesvirus 2]
MPRVSSSCSSSFLPARVRRGGRGGQVCGRGGRRGGGGHGRKCGCMPRVFSSPSSFLPPVPGGRGRACVVIQPPSPPPHFPPSLSKFPGPWLRAGGAADPPLLPPRARRPPTPAHHPPGLAGQTCVLCTIGPPSLSTRTHSFFTRQPAHPPRQGARTQAGAPALFYDKDQQASGVGAASRARPPSSSSLSPPPSPAPLRGGAASKANNKVCQKHHKTLL